jgi:mannose-6-phosphate isomerase-like protein (cupin superfamily)
VSAADETLRLGPRESVTVVVDSADLLEVEATYGPGGGPPPKHWHPAQDEHFEILVGAMCARVGDEERRLNAGDELDIPRRTVHQMWNCGDEPARVRWQTRPGLRTLEWFRAIDGLGREAKGRPGPLTLAPYVREYRDVFRLAGPDPLLQALFAVLAPIGRVRARKG